MINRSRFALCLTCAAAGLLSACSMFSAEKEKRVEGERISVLELQKELEPGDIALETQGFVAPKPWKNEFWPQPGGYPSHSLQHLALGDNLERVWRTSIGKGSARRIPLLAQPVVLDKTVYTLDTASRVSAFDKDTGKDLWSRSVRPDDEDENVIGGGLAYSTGRLFVTTGYNNVLALDPMTGETLWTADLRAPARAAPTVLSGRVFVVTLDNAIVALNTQTGELEWDFQGIGEGSGLIGAPAPAADDQIVVPAFSSGELYALRAENGAVAWSDNLAAMRTYSGGGIGAISDINAMPVIDKGLVFAISFNGRLVAIEERSGSRIWQREISGMKMPWVAGNSLFAMDTDGKLVALGRETGAIQWVLDLNGGDREPALWTGPVLAGGRLLVVGSNGYVVEVNPEDGTVLRDWKAGKSYHIAPVVAGETLYLLDDNGTLSVWR